MLSLQGSQPRPAEGSGPQSLPVGQAGQLTQRAHGSHLVPRQPSALKLPSRRGVPAGAVPDRSQLAVGPVSPPGDQAQCSRHGRDAGI